MKTSSSTALPQALTHHQRGELQQAIPLYRALLAAEPDNPDALHLLGVALLQSGQAPQAIELLEQAVARMPAES